MKYFIISIILFSVSLRSADFGEIIKENSEKNNDIIKEETLYKASRFSDIFSSFNIKKILKTDPENKFHTINDGLKNLFFKKNVSKNLKDVQKFYKTNDYQPIWIDEDDLTKEAEKALTLIIDSEIEGLNPDDYSYAVTAIKEFDESLEKSINAEIMLTKAFLHYIDDITNGRFNPREASNNIVIRPDSVNPVKYLKDGMSTNSTNWMDELDPPYKEYQNLKILLKKYIDKSDSIDWPIITLAPGKLIKVKDTHSELSKIRKLLKILGYYNGSSSNEDFYDVNFEKNIRTFQTRHGLLVDGIIGPQTFNALRMSPLDRMRRIIVSMERWRWMPRKPSKRYIRVNLPSFELQAVENENVILSSDVIVGKQTRKTPVFSAPMTDIVFNPSWNIPVSIAVKDKLHKIRKNPGYLDNHNYVLYNSSGDVISPYSVNWENYGKGHFPFRIRQRPGQSNALGKIKFNIQNNFAIYLHSTPNKKLFDKDIRMFSSGCIRVERVSELAKFVFNDSSKWSIEKINTSMEGSTTKRVNLKQKMQVYITYFTVGFDGNGNLFFAPDIYGQDLKVEHVIFGEKA